MSTYYKCHIAGSHSYFVVSPFKCEGENSYHELIPNPHIIWKHVTQVHIPVQTKMFPFKWYKTSQILDTYLVGATGEPRRSCSRSGIGIHVKCPLQVKLPTWKKSADVDLLYWYSNVSSSMISMIGTRTAVRFSFILCRSGSSLHHKHKNKPIGEDCTW